MINVTDIWSIYTQLNTYHIYNYLYILEQYEKAVVQVIFGKRLCIGSTLAYIFKDTYLLCIF